MNFFSSLLNQNAENSEAQDHEPKSPTLPTLPKTITTKSKSSVLTSNDSNDAPHVIIGVKNSPSAVGLKFETFEAVEDYFKDYAKENNFSMRRGM